MNYLLRLLKLRSASMTGMCLLHFLGCAAFAGQAKPPPADTTAAHPTKVAPFALADQYDHVHRFTLPLAKITVLTVADKKGSRHIEEWVHPLKQRYNLRIDIVGVADLRGVPGLFHGRVVKSFKQSQRYPVMLDWKGEVAEQLDCAKGQANVFVLDRQGRIVARRAGPATPDSLKELFSAIDRSVVPETP